MDIKLYSFQWLNYIFMKYSIFLRKLEKTFPSKSLSNKKNVYFRTINF